MATLTNEQIEQKKQQLKQLAEEAQQLKNELVEAGADSRGVRYLGHSSRHTQVPVPATMLSQRL